MGPISARITVGLLVAVSAVACGREAGTGGGDRGEKSVPQMSAAEFYQDYSRLKGADLLEKYSGGVAVSGPVKKSVYLGQDEGLQLWLAVDGPGHIAARFQDGGQAARQKKIKVGHTVALRCQINGKPDAVLFLVDCVLEEPPAAN